MSLPAHLFRTISRRSVLGGGPRAFSYSPSLLVRPQNPPKKPSPEAAPAAAAVPPQDPPPASPLANPSTQATPPPLEPFVNPGQATTPPTATFAEGAAASTPTPGTASPPPTGADGKAALPAVEEEVIPDRPDLSMLPSLDVDPTALPEPAAEGEEPGKPTGAKSSKAQGGFNTFDKIFLGSLGLGLVAGGWYLGRPLTDEERTKLNLKPEDAEPSLKDRAMSRTFSNYYVQYLTEPAWSELLPPPIPPIRPYTLLVDLEGILTCSKWDREHGWRTAKRPGADYFIAYLSQFYEIVLFTHQPSMNATPIAEKLDPYAAYMPYRLYRDATRLDFSAGGGGVTVKDLKYLNRDLSKVIMLDTNPDHALAQPDNALIIPKWTGDGNEGGLVALIPFLESVGIYQPQDVRPILKAYQGKDVAAEYNKVEAQRRELEYNTWAATPAGKRAIAKGEAGASGSSWSLSSLFGGQPPAPSTLKQDKPGPPPSYLDTKRGQAQAMYLQEQKYWKDNEAEIKKMMDEDRERQLKEMGGGTVLGMLGALSGAGGPPKADEQQPPAAK